MRTLKDRNGISVRIDMIRGEDAYAGMLEGTPYLARRFRLLQGRKAMEDPGHFVYGLDELERELGDLPKDTAVWAPNERWTAKLVGSTDYRRGVRHYVFVTWHQGAEDPMDRLARIVESIELEKYLQEVVCEVD